MNKRLLSFLLAIVLMLSSFAGCASNPDAGTPATSDTKATDAPTAAPTDAPVSSSSDQTPPQDEPDPVIEHTIKAENLASYRIVLGSAIKDQETVACAFVDELNSKLGTNETASADSVAYDYEIVVGKANRTETNALLAPRHDSDGLVACVGNRIFITSETAEGLEKATRLFWETYYNANTKTIRIKDGDKSVDSEFALPKDLKINGVPLSEYTIIYPAKADRITLYTAYALADYFEYNANVKFKTRYPYPDTKAESQYEILIGDTNRTASKQLTSAAFSDTQYALYTDGSKIVCNGSGFYAGSAVYELISTYFPDTGEVIDPVNVTTLSTTATVKNFVFPKATSTIMMIGDGMGINHIQMALTAGAIDHFYGYDLPFQTWCKTYSANSSVTDSAASATALATGYKTNNGVIGKNASLANVVNVSEVAYMKGARVGVLTTDTLDGATPAGFNVHTNDRNNSSDILSQFNQKLASGQLLVAQGKLNDLVQPTREALGMLSKGDSTFFIMIEEAYTDKGSHSNAADTSNSAVKRLNEAIAYAIAFVMLHPDTALLITADHETGGLTSDGKGGFKYTTTSHTGTDVPYFALGGENVAEFIATDTKLNNVWNAMFIASIYGVDKFGDPSLRYNK